MTDETVQEVPEPTAPPATPHDHLRMALADLNHAATLDLHDRLHAMTATLNTIGTILLHGVPNA